MIEERTRVLLAWMLAELRSNRLEVIQCNGLRQVISANCDWYQQLCRNHCRPRKRYPRLRTIIKRRDTIRALERMLEGNLRGVYAERILAVLESLDLPEWEETACTEFEIPP